MATTLTPNMSLPVPGVGTESGPQYATDINSCLSIVDAHDHTPGSGVQITPSAIDINADLLLNGNNLTTARSLRLSAQSAVLNLATDLGCLYEVGVDLYYNDGLGNHVRITQSGAVSGTPGSISNLVAPASASYSAGSKTFTWQSDALTPANLDAGSVIIRNVLASSEGVTVSVPSPLAASYTMTLPTAPPASTLPMSMSSSGAISTGSITVAQLDAAVLTRFATVQPSVQRYLTGSGTYTPSGSPRAPAYIRVRMVGAGGGGGGGNGGSSTAGTAGASTTFADGTNTLTAGGGSGGNSSLSPTRGAAGGSNTINPASPTSYNVLVNVSGGSGGPSSNITGSGAPGGGMGGSSYFGGAGSGGGITTGGGNATANSGSGGGGGAGNFSGPATSAPGGGSGGYLELTIGTVAASYTYSVGAGGTHGNGSTSSFNGGNGADGILIVEEFY